MRSSGKRKVVKPQAGFCTGYLFVCLFVYLLSCSISDRSHLTSHSMTSETATNTTFTECYSGIQLAVWKMKNPSIFFFSLRSTGHQLKFLQLVRCWATFSASFSGQTFSSSSFCLFTRGLQVKACLVVLEDGSLRVCPIQPRFLPLVFSLFLLWGLQCY